MSSSAFAANTAGEADTAGERSFTAIETRRSQRMFPGCIGATHVTRPSRRSGVSSHPTEYERRRLAVQSAFRDDQLSPLRSHPTVAICRYDYPSTRRSLQVQ